MSADKGGRLGGSPPTLRVFCGLGDACRQAGVYEGSKDNPRVSTVNQAGSLPRHIGSAC